MKYPTLGASTIGTLDQHQDVGSISSFGFGQFAAVRYRGQNFTPAISGTLGAIGFKRDAPTVDIKVYIDTTTSHLPTNAVGAELYSWTIPVGQINTRGDFQVFPLPTPLSITSGTEYCFYLAPFSGGIYTDDYHDLKGINTTPGGLEITNTNGVWTTEVLTLYFATYMIQNGVLVPVNFLRPRPFGPGLAK